MELKKAVKKKERVDREEREMYKRMVEGVSKGERTGAQKQADSRPNRWVSGSVELPEN